MAESDSASEALNMWLRDMSRSRRSFRMATLRQLCEINEELHRLNEPSGSLARTARDLEWMRLHLRGGW
jgi:hypothetical protein